MLCFTFWDFVVAYVTVSGGLLSKFVSKLISIVSVMFSLLFLWAVLLIEYASVNVDTFSHHLIFWPRMISICVIVEVSVWPLRLLYLSVSAVHTDPMSVGSRRMSSRNLSKTCSTVWEQSSTTRNCVWIHWQAKKLYNKYDWGRIAGVSGPLLNRMSKESVPWFWWTEWWLLLKYEISHDLTHETV